MAAAPAAAHPRADRASLLASALDAIVSIDADDRIVEFNPSAQRMLGHRLDDALGRSLTDLIVPEALRAAHRAGVQRVVDGADFRLLGKRIEVSALRADGSEFPVELTITQTSEDPFMVTAFMRDLSERRDADAALRASEERLQLAFAQAPVGIALISLDPATPGRVLQANRALCEMLGYDQSVLLGGDFQSLTHPDDIDRNVAMFADALAGRCEGYSSEKRFRRADGSWMWAHVQATIARDHCGVPLYGISQVHDVTARRETDRALRESEARLARTQRLARICSWSWCMTEDRLDWSDGLSDVFGPVDPDVPFTQEHFVAAVHPDDRARILRVFEDSVSNKLEATWEYRIVHPDGQTFDLYAWGKVVCDDDGRPVRQEGYVQDVTERKSAERQAASLQRDNERILDAAGEGIFRVDAEGRTTFVNPAAEELLGHASGALVGRPAHEVFHHSHADGSPHAREASPVHLSAVDGEIRRVEGDVFWRADGTPLAVDYTSAPLRVGDRLTGAVVVFSDVTERRQLEEQLRDLADHDPLTGLLNRRRFEQTLAARLADPRGSAALLLLDLDHFKFVNDSFGHAAGDDLIRAVASVLQDEIRDRDLLARLGGDEFAIMLDRADEPAAHAVGARILRSLERAQPSGLRITASIGMTCFGGEVSASASDLLVAADIALYEAKDAGRGRVQLFAGRPGTSLTWVQRIRSALADDGLVLYSQPIIDVTTGEAVQEELLVRMLDEHGGIIPPSSFLPTAEAFGLVGEIDRWVLRRGVELAAEGRCVHVNLSGASIGSATLVDELAEQLAASGADPRLIVLELTETHAVANMADAKVFAARLRELGCRLALDDFGTGFGSFTYLKHLPSDYLKIDMEFVRDIAVCDADRRVVESIVAIAERFGLAAIAEGVEDERCLEALRQAGVRLVQGYHVGRPGPIDP